MASIEDGAKTRRLQEDIEAAIIRNKASAGVTMTALASELGVLIQDIAERYPEQKEQLRKFADGWHAMVLRAIKDPEGVQREIKSKHSDYSSNVMKELGKTSPE